MGARTVVYFAPDGADLGGLASIRTDALLEDSAAHHSLLGCSVGLFYIGRQFHVLGRQLCDDCVAQGVDGRVLFGFGQSLAKDIFQIRLYTCQDFLLQLIGNAELLIIAFWLADFLGHLQLQVDERLESFVRFFQRRHHRFFIYFACAAFHHEDGFAGAGHAQVQIGLFELRVSWIDNEASVDASYAHRPDRSVPWDVGDHQRRGCRVDRDDVDDIFLIRR